MPDWGIDDDFPPQPATDATPPARELVPEGDHLLQIKAVIRHDEEKKVEIRLEHPDRRYGWVFARVPMEASWGKRVLSSLRKALGCTSEEWAALDITDLVGRRVRARIYHKAGGTRTYVNVGEFLSAGVETATASPVVERAVAPPARRTPTQKADAVASMPEDDIPF